MLSGVTALSASNVWTVGNQGSSNGPVQTLIEHWNGTQWKVISSPNGKARYNSLASVVAISPGDIWAVGFEGLNFDIRPHALIEHWNGMEWSIVPSPDGPYSTGNQLSAVSLVSAQSAWAVGFSEDSSVGVSATLIEYYC